jgi:hypothetical protein
LIFTPNAPENFMHSWWTITGAMAAIVIITGIIVLAGK